MRDKIIQYGHKKTVILISIFSIIGSVLAYIPIGYIFVKKDFLDGILIAIIIPSIIAPTLSWYMVKLFIKIHYLEIKMRKLATFDTLTNVMSRQAFLKEADKIYQTIKDNNSTLAILYIDIDDFKKINDNYGHSFGDEILENFGYILNQSKKGKDIVGRLGGEEFAFILPNYNLKNTIEFSKNLLKEVSNQTLKYNNQNISYTISIGISILDNQNRVTLDTLIKQSDKALYKAKHSGKNCYIVYKNT